ncbi:MAG: hypothetical protein KTR21_15355 [Rhodobacteraceae bacterium]|nr:hypothetical protein [Paracoccaceae bacterium]
MAILHADPAIAGGITSIQTAVDAVRRGDVIQIAAGGYNELTRAAA